MPSPSTAGADGGLDDEAENFVAFPILDLPPELVIRIIEQVVVISSKDEPIVIKECAKAHQEPAITRVCHLFRCEGLSLFYEYNNFVVLSTEDATFELFKWIRHIGLQRASTIQNLRQYWYTQERSDILDWEDLLDEMSFLEAVARGRGLERTFVNQISVRFKDGKIVLGSDSGGRYYELSFGQMIQARAEWRQVAELSDSYAFDSSERHLRDKDFWVSDSSSETTASEMDKQKGGRAVE